jgi:hypothetical protein
MAQKFFLFKREEPALRGGAVFSDNGKGISVISLPANNLAYMAADRGALIMYFNNSAPFEENSLTLAGESFEKTSITVTCEVGKETDLMENIISFINKNTVTDVMKFDAIGGENTFRTITPSPNIDTRVRARPVERGLVGTEAIVSGLDANAIVNGIDFLKVENKPFVDYGGENITAKDGHVITTLVNSGVGGNDYDLVNDGPICRNPDTACNSKTISFDKNGELKTNVSFSGTVVAATLPSSLSNSQVADYKRFKTDHVITSAISVTSGSLVSFTGNSSKSGTVVITRGGVDVTPSSNPLIPTFDDIESDGATITQCRVNNTGNNLFIGDVVSFDLQNHTSINISFTVASDDIVDSIQAILRDSVSLNQSAQDDLGLVIPKFTVSTNGSGNLTSFKTFTRSSNLLAGDVIYVSVHDPNNPATAHGLIIYTVSQDDIATEFSRSVMQIVERIGSNIPQDPTFPYTDYVTYMTLVIPPGTLMKPLHASKYNGVPLASPTFVSNMGPFPYDSLGNEFEVNHGVFSDISSSHPQSSSFEALFSSFPFVQNTQQEITSEENLYTFVVRRTINRDLFIYSKDGELVASRKSSIDEEDTQLDVRYLGMVLPFNTNEGLIRIARFGVVGKDLGDLTCRNLATQLYNRYKHKAANLA